MLKAIFMKAVTVNDDKLNESTIYADAIAEAAATEVETVIKGAIASEEFSKFNTNYYDFKRVSILTDLRVQNRNPFLLQIFPRHFLAAVVLTVVANAVLRRIAEFTSKTGIRLNFVYDNV